MSGRLNGQIAWISGAASGIGAATARLFASEGASVAIADVRDKDGQQLVDEITSGGGRAFFSHCDVGSEDQVQQSIEDIVSKWNGLQIVVNCAGIVHVGLLHEYSESDWDRLMNINLKSIFFAIKHSFPHLRLNDRSYMVNIGSISSFVAQRSTPVYTTSKGAVLSLTKSIALDYATIGLRCNCICPGITDTPMLREHINSAHNPEETLRQRERRVPMNRTMQSAEIARSILYLACEDSAGVTGTSVVVDGGYLAAAEWDTADDSLKRRDDK